MTNINAIRDDNFRFTSFVRKVRDSVNNSSFLFTNCNLKKSIRFQSGLPPPGYIDFPKFINLALP